MSDFAFDSGRATKWFFDKAKVLAAMNQAEVRALGRFGAWVRNAARWSIRTRKKGASQPGQPPFNKTGYLKDGILYYYDPAKHSVVIGPKLLNQVHHDGDGNPVTGTIPAVLEYGGSIQKFEVLQYGSWRRPDFRSRRRWAGLPTRLVPVRIEARPYMGPAFERGKREQLDRLWSGAMARAA